MRANMREFLSWAQRHYSIDVTSSTVQRKTGEPTSVGPCPGGCKDFTHQGSNARFIKVTCKICVPFGVKNVISHDKTRLHALIDTRMTGEAMHPRERHIAFDCGTYIDSVPRQIDNVLEATRSASSKVVMMRLQTVYWTRRSRSDNSILPRGRCWNKFRVCQMEIMSSQRWFNFSWIAFTAQRSHPLRLFRSESDPCILTITKL